MPRQSNTSPQTGAVLGALLAATDGWSYGYDLAKATGLKSGTLYPILMRLEAQGWLEARWEENPPQGKPPRHLYRLTSLGAKQASAIRRQAAGSEAVEAFRPAGERGVG